MLGLLLVSFASAGQIYDQTQSAAALIWAGVDYSRARFFVPETFDNPEEITFFNPGGGLRDAVRRYEKPQDTWNDLVKEWNMMAQHDLMEEFEKVVERDFTSDLPTEAGQTQGKKEPYFESQYEAKNYPMDMTSQTVADMVKKYRLKTKDGLGLVFIYERGSTLDKQGCLWPTWFDGKTKAVIKTERICEKPSGLGFRNLWLGPVLSVGEDMIKALKKKEL
jgi:hypothetical protein